MKKLFALALVVLGLAACQTEPEGLDVNVGGEVETLINVSVPESATRAAAGTNSAEGVFKNGVLASDDYTMRYILQIYTADGNPSNERLVAYSDDKSVVFPVRLIAGRDYKYVVWADVVESEDDTDLHYNTSNLKNITLNDTWKAMDETRDAFTASVDVEDYSKSSSLNITLYRPFAKLRIVTTDIQAVRNLNVEPTTATVTYTTAYRESFNAYESKANAAGSSKKVHTDYAIKSYGETGDELTLFTDYFFAEQDVVKFDFAAYDQNGDLIAEESFGTDIPVERNYLTTLKGSILTDASNVTVTVSDPFAGELGKEDDETFAKVDTTEELLEAINKGVDKIILEGDNDIIVDESVSIPAGVTTTVDLNGKSLKGADSSVNVFVNEGELTITGSGEITTRNILNRPGAKLVVDGDFTIIGGAPTAGSAIWNEGDAVINNVTIQQINTTNYAIKNVTAGATLVVNNANVISKHGAIANDAAGTLTVNGGYYEVTGSSTDHVIYSPNGGITINDGTFNLSQTNASSIGSTIIDGAVVVNGGTFDSVDGAFAYDGEAGLVVYGGTFKNKATTVYGGDFAQFVPAGYAVVDNGNDTYTVVNLRAPEVEIYGLTLKPDGENSKIIVNDKEGFLNLTKLFNDWTALFTDGNGTTYTNYANGAGTDYYYAGRWTVSLEADIDLNNATISPIIIKHPVSAGEPTFAGNNHTIKNAKIVTDPATENEAGLFVSSRCGFTDLKLDNIHVTGSNVGNSTAGVLAGSNSVGIDNITITNSSVEGGKYTGGVIGYGYTDVTNCSLTNVSVKGGYKLGGLIGYICASNGNTGEVTGNTLTECSVDGIGSGIYAGGKSEYIIGMLVGNYNCDGSCKDNVVYDMTTTANKIIGKIEAGKVVNESNNIVTYIVGNYEELKTAVINGGKIELANDITVDEWIMFSESLNMSSGEIITIAEMNVTINGNDHTLTVNDIESAGNGNSLFHDASVLNISNLTIKYADGLAGGGIGMDSGVIKNVHFIGGGNTIYPHSGEILVEECIFDNNGAALYFEHECDNLTVTGCTFNQKADQNVILLRGDVKFTDNIINSGRTVNVVSGSPVVTGNNFNNVRFKVYGAATATISNNIINNLEFDGNTYASTFTNNTLSSAAQAVLDSKTKVN